MSTRKIHLVILLGIVVTSSSIPMVAVALCCYTDGTGGCNNHNLCFDGVEELLRDLSSPAGRDSDYRLVRSRNGMKVVQPRHQQYGAACFFFTAATVLEHQGWAQFQQNSTATMAVRYVQNRPPAFDNVVLDYGYAGSPEHLMGTYIGDLSEQHGCSWSGGQCTADTTIYPRCDFYTGDVCLDTDGDGIGDAVDYGGSPRNFINNTQLNCSVSPIYNPYGQYGECAAGGPQQRPQYLSHLSGTVRPGNVNDTTGGLWLLNSGLAEQHYIGGCNDARSIVPNSGDPEHIRIARELIKIFIDRNIPLMASVNRGRHFMPIIGYADLDAQALPKKAILADPVQMVFWTADLLKWNVDDRASLWSILPWNQHLDGGCEENSWAAAWDFYIKTVYGDSQGEKFSICGPDGWHVRCVERTFGLTLRCVNILPSSQRKTNEYFASLEDPFIEIEDSESCDEVYVLFADGSQRAVVNAEAKRFGFIKDPNVPEYDTYSPQGFWEQLHGAYDASGLSSWHLRPGMTGNRTLVSFANWNENYWLAARNRPGKYSRVRTTVTLDFDDGSHLSLEIAPPGTYGIELECLTFTDDPDWPYVQRYGGSAPSDVQPAAGEDHFRHIYTDTMLTRRCDQLKLRVALGAGVDIARAELQREYYGTVTWWFRRWKPLTRVWHPDETTILSGWSGRALEFIWGESWLDGFPVSARNFASGSQPGDRRTVIWLYDSSGNVVREVEVTPAGN